MGFLDKVGEQFQKGTDAMIKGSEKFARTSSLKIDIKNLQQAKQKKLKDLSYKVYDLYTKGLIKEPQLLNICQDVKVLQWQINEKREELEALKKIEQGQS